ncbi:MAG: hypothetical protein WEC15_01710 [Flavobacteriales bacterium]
MTAFFYRASKVEEDESQVIYRLNRDYLREPELTDEVIIDKNGLVVTNVEDLEESFKGEVSMKAVYWLGWKLRQTPNVFPEELTHLA